jgi:O-antigen/teichoic acid export membrane protein
LRRLPRNLLASLGATVAILVLNLIMSRVVVHRLMAVEYGAWVVMSSFVAYTALLDLGISQALVRVVATERGTSGGKSERHVGVAFRTYLALGLVAFVVVMLGGLGYLYSRGLDVRPGSELFTADLILAFGGLISLPGSVFTAVLAGHERYGAINVVGTGAALVTTTSTVAVFLVHGSILALAIITVMVIVAATAIRIVLAGRVEPQLWGALKKGGDFKSFVQLLLLSAGFFVQGAAVMVIWRLDPLVVGIGVSLAAVTMYSLAQRLATAYSDLGTPIFFAAMPTIARTHAGGESSQVQWTLTMLTRFALVVALPGTILLAVESKRLMSMWVGPLYDADWPVAALLMIAVGVSIVRNPSLVALQAVYSVRKLAWFHALEGGANLALSVALVVPLHEMGVAIGTFVPSVGFSLFAYLRTAMNHFGLKPASVFGWLSVRAAAAGVLAAPWLFLDIPIALPFLVLMHATTYLVTYLALIGLLTPRQDRESARRLAERALRAALVPGANS